MFVRTTHYTFVKPNVKVALVFSSNTSLPSLPLLLIQICEGSAKAEDTERNGCHQHSRTRLIRGDQAEWLSELAH